MPIPSKLLADFKENSIYHVFNRTNNRERLFLSDNNRFFFLRQYKNHISQLLDTYSWNLQPNHFHFLVKAKTSNDIKKYLELKGLLNLTLTEKRFLYDEISQSELTENGFKRFFQSYAQSFNNMHNRSGNLFYKPFKRIEVVGDSYFNQAMIYIHANAVKHGLVKDIHQYKWSFWHSILSGSPTSLLRTEILDWFGGKERFIKINLEMTKFYYETDVAIED
jgi:REP element-mobilizing transposase RayT